MNTNALYIHFAELLHVENITFFQEVCGPYFYRWLPDGKKDALRVLSNKKMDVMFYFNRWGESDPSWPYIEYKHGIRLEISESELVKQAVYTGGPIFGLIKYHEPSSSLIHSLNNQEETEEVLSFRKSVAGTISKYLPNLINIFKVTYGQFWLPSIKTWDAEEDPSHYLYHFQTQWSIDNENWKRLKKPGAMQFKLKNEEIETSINHYISKSDWKKIEQLAANPSASLLFHEIFIQAQQSNDISLYDYAIIKAYSCLELAMTHFIQKGLTNLSKELNEKIKNTTKQEMLSLSLRSKVGQFFMQKNHLDHDVQKDIFDMMEKRNEIVHEGTHHHTPISKWLLSLANVLSVVDESLNIRLLRSVPLNRYNGNYDPNIDN